MPIKFMCIVKKKPGLIYNMRLPRGVLETVGANLIPNSFGSRIQLVNLFAFRLEEFPC